MDAKKIRKSMTKPWNPIEKMTLVRAWSWIRGQCRWQRTRCVKFKCTQIGNPRKKWYQNFNILFNNLRHNLQNHEDHENDIDHTILSKTLQNFRLENIKVLKYLEFWNVVKESENRLQSKSRCCFIIIFFIKSSSWLFCLRPANDVQMFDLTDWLFF